MFSEAVQICDDCHGVTPARQFARSGCRNRLSLPPCGNDDEVDIKHGPAHGTPTAEEKRLLNRQYERMKAFRARQKSAWAQQDLTSARPRAVNMVRDVSPPAAPKPSPTSHTATAPSPEAPGTHIKRVVQLTSGGASDVSKSPTSPDRGNDKKALGKPASVSANLSATFHVLDAEQIPLLSLGVLEQAARAAGGHLNHSTCSETNTATLVLKFPNERSCCALGGNTDTRSCAVTCHQMVD